MLMRGLNQERLLLAANGGGASLRCIDVARDFARDRVVFGSKIANYQAVSHNLQTCIILRKRRAWPYSMPLRCWMRRRCRHGNHHRKIVSTDNNYRVADLAMQVMGGAGYIEGEMQRLFREARLGPIGGGSNEVLRNVIAGRMDLTRHKSIKGHKLGLKVLVEAVR